MQYISSFEPPKDGVFISTILYAGYNILCCSGVLVPLSNETKRAMLPNVNNPATEQEKIDKENKAAEPQVNLDNITHTGGGIDE